MDFIKRKVFFSFHFERDFWRVQQIRNIGCIERNQPIAPNAWEEIKKQGDFAIKKWIDENLYNTSCTIVLVGSQTANRKWVRYEIEQTWKCDKALLGIRSMD